MKGTKDAPQKPNLLHWGKFHTFKFETAVDSVPTSDGYQFHSQFAGTVLISLRAKF
jgi:hypothetical protein